MHLKVREAVLPVQQRIHELRVLWQVVCQHSVDHLQQHSAVTLVPGAPQKKTGASLLKNCMRL